MPSRSLVAGAVTVLTLIVAGIGTAQTLPAGPQVLTFFSDVDDTEQPYGLYIPPNYDAARRYPLVISLHGGGSNHRLNLRRVFGRSNAPGENDVEASRYFPSWDDVEYIVATPLARGSMGYQGLAEKDVYDVLADVKRRFSIDEDRVYLTGLSMGGGGALWLGLSRPDLWAAIAIVCPAVPEGAEELAPNGLNVPFHLFQGDVDPVTLPERTREWVELLRANGARVEYVEYPGVSHNSWENAYADGRIFEWFGRFRRDRYPERVSFTSARYEYDGAYWVRLDAFTPGTPASIEARFTGANRVVVSTRDLDGFSFVLDGHPQFQAERPLEVIIDGRAVRVRAGEPTAFHRQGGRWVAGRYQAQEGEKRKGSEGPLGAVISDRHVYVYGTAGDPSPEEIQARRAEAEIAANWHVGGRPLLVFPRVVADTLVRPSDHESAHLVLFGTAETNRLIARLSERLPMQLDPAAAGEYGLVYVLPANGRYVLVSSGLPWWSRAAPLPAGFGAMVDPERRRWRPHAAPGGPLMYMPDFVLFRGGADQVVVQGHFDRNWGIRPADARALNTSGVVRMPVVHSRAARD
jgi:predicted esterase